MGRAQLDKHSTAKWCSLFFREFLALGKNTPKYIFLALNPDLTLLIRINCFFYVYVQ